jgi:hypothetical protein
MAGELHQTGKDWALQASTGILMAPAGPGAQRAMYVALLAAAPTTTSTLASVTELSATGYSRQALGPTAISTSGANRRVTNTALITFGPFSTDPASATHALITTAASSTTGDISWIFTLDTAKDAGIGDSITIAANALVCDLD